MLIKLMDSNDIKARIFKQIEMVSSAKFADPELADLLEGVYIAIGVGLKDASKFNEGLLAMQEGIKKIGELKIREEEKLTKIQDRHNEIKTKISYMEAKSKLGRELNKHDLEMLERASSELANDNDLKAIFERKNDLNLAEHAITTTAAYLNIFAVLKKMEVSLEGMLQK